MNGFLIGSVLGMGLLAPGGLPAGGPARPAARAAGWMTDYQAAKAAARRSGKPMMVVFR
jgi:hypothetical protein